MNCDSLFQQVTNAGCNFQWSWPTWSVLVVLALLALAIIVAAVIVWIRERRRDFNGGMDALAGIGMHAARRRGWLPEDLQ